MNAPTPELVFPPVDVPAAPGVGPVGDRRGSPAAESARGHGAGCSAETPADTLGASFREALEAMRARTGVFASAPPMSLVGGPGADPALRDAASAVRTSLARLRVLHMLQRPPTSTAELAAAWQRIANRGNGDCLFYSLADGDTSPQADRIDVELGAIVAMRKRLAQATLEWFRTARRDPVTGENNPAYRELVSLLAESDTRDRMAIHLAHLASAYPDFPLHRPADWATTELVPAERSPSGEEEAVPSVMALTHFATAYCAYIQYGGWLGVGDTALLAALYQRVVVLFCPLLADDADDGRLQQAVVLGMPTMEAARSEGDTARPAAPVTVRGVTVIAPARPELIVVYYQGGHFEGLQPYTGPAPGQLGHTTPSLPPPRPPLPPPPPARGRGRPPGRAGTLKASRTARGGRGRGAARAAPSRGRAPGVGEAPVERDRSLSRPLPSFAGLQDQASAWETLLEPVEGVTVLANIGTLRRLLATVPIARLHLPHSSRPTISELFAWWSPKRSRVSLKVERLLTAAIALAYECLDVALAAAHAQQHLPVPVEPQLDVVPAYAFAYLLPTFMLTHPGGDSSISSALVHRLNLWAQGQWEQLFSDAGIWRGTLENYTWTAGMWTLGMPGPAQHRPDDERPAAPTTEYDGCGGDADAAAAGGRRAAAVASCRRTLTEQQAARAIRLVRDYELSRAMTTLTPTSRLDPADPAVRELLVSLHPPLHTGAAIYSCGGAVVTTASAVAEPLHSPRVEEPLLADDEGADDDPPALLGQSSWGGPLGAVGHAGAVAELDEALPFSRAEFAAAIRGLSVGSAPGPCGLRDAHLKLAVSQAPELQDIAPRLLASLHSVSCAVAMGRLPLQLRDSFATASLSALRKPSSPGTVKARPVAAGNILRRVIAACLARKHVAELRRAAGPFQVAVGRSSAAEGAVTAIRQAMHHDRHAHVAAFDAVNAFNAMSRQRVVDKLVASVPKLRTFVEFVYGGRPIPITARSASHEDGYIVLASAEGVQQGDPLGPALFAVALADALVEIHRRLTVCASQGPPRLRPRFLLVAYLDDITVVAQAPLLRAALHHVPLVLQRECQLEVNVPKTQVWPPLPPTMILPMDVAHIEAMRQRGVSPATLYSQSMDQARWEAAAAFGMGGGERPPPHSDDGPRRGSLAAAGVADHHADSAPLVPYRPRGRALWGSEEHESLLVAGATTVHGAVILGTPVGEAVWETQHVAGLFEAVSSRDLPTVCAFAASAPEALQCALILLRQCVFPRASARLRMLRPERTRTAATEFDLAFRWHAATAMALPPALLCDAMSEVSRRASLPARDFGGLQLRRLADLCDVAFIAGAADGAAVAAGLLSASDWPMLEASAPPCPSGLPLSAALPAVASSSPFASVPFFCELGVEEAYQRVAVALRASDGDMEAHTAEPGTPGERAAARVLDLDTRIVAATAPPVSQAGAGPVTSTSRWTADGQRVSQRDGLQHAITAVLERMAHAVLRESMDPMAADHLDAAGMRGAYDWVTTVPHTWELTLCGAHYQVAVARRLRLPLTALSPSELARIACTRCKRVGQWDPRMCHAFDSQCGGHRDRIHNRIAAVFYMAANAAGWPTHLATSADVRTLPGEPLRSRLPDIVMHGCTSVCPPSGLVSMNCDVAIAHAEAEGSAMAERMPELVRAKRAKHAEPSRRLNRVFVPLVLNGLGGIGQEALDLLRRMAESLCAQSLHTDDVWRREHFVSFWVRRVSIVMQQAAGDAVLRVHRVLEGGSQARVARLFAHLTLSAVGGPGVTSWDQVDSGQGAYARAARVAGACAARGRRARASVGGAAAD